MKVTKGLALIGCLAVMSSGCSSGSDADSSKDLGSGITTPKELEPFTPSDSVGEKPDLPKSIAFAQSSSNGFEELMAVGLRAGAKDAGLKYQVANSDGDPQKHVQNMNQFLVQGVGSLVTNAVNPDAQKDVQLAAMGKGVMMNSVLVGPATSQLGAPLYAEGEALAKAAAEHIKSELGGKASVVILNQDSVEAVRPRFAAMRDVFKEMPSVKIVADIEPKTIDNQGGFQTMTTILQTTPKVDVVLGGDAVVVGALGALETAKKSRPDQFLAGADCDERALAEIIKGGAYKACVGTEPAVFSYAWARYAGDWLEGKSVPQAISALAYTVNGPEEADQYRQDQREPARVFSDPSRLAKYLGLFGNISYETRDKYLAYSYNPEAK